MHWKYKKVIQNTCSQQYRKMSWSTQIISMFHSCKMINVSTYFFLISNVMLSSFHTNFSITRSAVCVVLACFSVCGLLVTSFVSPAIVHLLWYLYWFTFYNMSRAIKCHCSSSHKLTSFDQISVLVLIISFCQVMYV